MSAPCAAECNERPDQHRAGKREPDRRPRQKIDRLKIDQSFIKRLGLDDTSTEITAAMISLGQKLRLKVIAEGVETQLQFEKLHELGCDEIQGFLFSKPVSESDLVALLQQPAAALKSAGIVMFEQRPGLSSAV